LAPPRLKDPQVKEEPREELAPEEDQRLWWVKELALG
jgi:hypothetical protein